jgi:predicted DNA-binding protein (MmcQ/YjbR family)
MGSKISAFLGTPGEDDVSVGVKCGGRSAVDEWLARFPDEARPMPYIGRSRWNTLSAGRSIPDDEIREAVDASYDFVVAKLPWSQQPPDGGRSTP